MILQVNPGQKRCIQLPFFAYFWVSELKQRYKHPFFRDYKKIEMTYLTHLEMEKFLHAKCCPMFNFALPRDEEALSC